MVVEEYLIVVAGMELIAEEIESRAVLVGGCVEVEGAGVLVTGVIVAADEELTSTVEVATFVTGVVVVVGVVGTDVAAELVETDCVVVKGGEVVELAGAVLVAAVDELVGRAVLVVLREVLGRAEALVMVVGGEETTVEVTGSVVVNVEVAVGRVVEAGVMVAAVVELVGGAVLVALCEVLGRAEVLVMVVGDEEETTVEVMGSVVVNVEVAMGRVVEAGVMVAAVVVSG